MKGIYDCHLSEQEQSRKQSIAERVHYNGSFSVTAVASAVEKVFHKEKPQSGAKTTVEFFSLYLDELEIHDGKNSLARRLTDIRNAFAHACVAISDASTVQVYNFCNARKKEPFKLIAEYSQEQFYDMCAIMRRVFLSWERIATYLPHTISLQALEVEARKELPAAVLIR